MRESNVFVSVIWGDAYIISFLRFTIPSIMSERNLAALMSLESPEYLIYTMPDYVDRLESAPIIAELRRCFPVRILVIRQGKYESHAHELTRHAHIDTIRYAAIRSAAIWFLQGECIYGDGTLETIRDAAKAGIDAFLTFAPRVGFKGYDLLWKEPGVMDELKSERLTLPNRRLARLSLEAPSSMTHIANFVDSPDIMAWPVILIWRLGRSATLMRGMHMCPIYLRPQTYCDSFQYCIDGDLVPRSIHDWRRIHIPQNSDEFSIVSMCPNEHKEYNVKLDGKLDLDKMARFMAYHMGEFERYMFFNTAITTHDGSDLSGYTEVFYQQEEVLDILRNKVSKYRRFA